MTTMKSLIDRLLAAAPELRAVYDEHIADNEELLPHVFFGDVSRFAVAHASAPSAANLLRVVDEALGDADAEVREVLLASFVENVAVETAALQQLKPKMGLNLRRALQQFEP